MISNNIVFRTTGHDDFIDFIKAYSILVVVFCHGFPYLQEVGYAVWGVQIPLFFLIQVFHCYKREPRTINWRVIAKRIIYPFVLIELLILCVLSIRGKGDNVVQLLQEGVKTGGFGPGSYYPWIYLQMTIIIPFFRPVCERLGRWKSLLTFIMLSETIEIFCSLINLPDSVYRLLCLRYVMLIWFGWIWAKEGIRLNFITILASIISFCLILYLSYSKRSFEPWLYSTNWITHRWICYFWSSFLFVCFLFGLYRLLAHNSQIMNAVNTIASASYEIFLMQMAYYSIITLSSFNFIGNRIIQYLIWFALAFVVSIKGGVMVSRLQQKYIR